MPLMTRSRSRYDAVFTASSSLRPNELWAFRTCWMELRPRLILASSAASTLTRRLLGLSGRERSAGIHSGATASTHTDVSTAPERRNADTDTNAAQAGAPIPSSEITGADTQLLVVSEQTEPEEPLTLSRSQLEVSRPQHEKWARPTIKRERVKVSLRWGPDRVHGQRTGDGPAPLPATTHPSTPKAAAGATWALWWVPFALLYRCKHPPTNPQLVRTLQDLDLASVSRSLRFNSDAETSMQGLGTTAVATSSDQHDEMTHPRDPGPSVTPGVEGMPPHTRRSDLSTPAGSGNSADS